MDNIENKMIDQLILSATEQGRSAVYEYHEKTDLIPSDLKPRKILKSVDYLCKRCNKPFETKHQFYRHFVLRGVPCDRKIDEEVYVRRHLDILARGYAIIKKYAESDLDDEIRIKKLQQFHKKAKTMLVVLESHPSLITDGIVDQNVVTWIKVMIQNCLTGDFQNQVRDETINIDEK